MTEGNVNKYKKKLIRFGSSEWGGGGKIQRAWKKIYSGEDNNNMLASLMLDPASNACVAMGVKVHRYIQKGITFFKATTLQHISAN